MGSPSPTFTSTLVCPLRAVDEAVFLMFRIDGEREKEKKKNRELDDFLLKSKRIDESPSTTAVKEASSGNCWPSCVLLK